MKGLEDKANLSIANCGEFRIGQFVDVCPIQPIVAACRMAEAAHNIQECGFAAAGLSDDGHKFALFNLNIQVVKRMYRYFAGGKDFIDVA